MDNKEMLYEISLKYNTLKMYENTIDQMKKNGNTGETLTNIIAEKNNVEKELVELLNPKLPESNTINNCAKDPSICEKKLNGNKFIQAQKKKAEYKRLYDIRNSFYDNITPKNMSFDVIPTKEETIVKREKEMESKKPKYSDIQEKISNSQWISCSNFIVRFDKNKVNIDEWRVSSFYYRCDNILSVTVNDFSEKNEDGSYNILMQIVSNLINNRYAGNICADVIDNSGELLYKMVFEDCDFTYADSDGFTYESTELRKVILNFHYKILHVLSPNEKLNETAN